MWQLIVETVFVLSMGPLSNTSNQTSVYPFETERDCLMANAALKERQPGITSRCIKARACKIHTVKLAQVDSLPGHVGDILVCQE